MISDVIVWVCRTPSRFAAVVGLPVVLLLVGGSLIVKHGPSASDTTGKSGDQVVTTATTAATQPDAGPSVRAAVAFATAWSHLAPGETAIQWHKAVAALATAELAAGLSVTDPATLPGGTVSGSPVVRFVSTDSALVAVPLSTGQSIAVTVVLADGNWKVSDVQPDVGDTGSP